MYPVIFRIGDFEITGFGVLVAVAALVGLGLFRRELVRGGLPSTAIDAAVAGVVGGLIGAKLLWTLEFLGEQPFSDLLFSRGGLSWFGGLFGGFGTGLWMLRRRQVPLVPALAAVAPALAVGHAIGRIGCFMVGDDYGRPSNLPFGQLPSHRVCRRQMCLFTRRSFTKPQPWQSLPGCCYGGGTEASLMHSCWPGISRWPVRLAS